MPNWDNYIMKKYGQSIKKKIIEAYWPFKKATTIVEASQDKDKTEMMDYAEKELKDVK